MGHKIIFAWGQCSFYSAVGTMYDDFVLQSNGIWIAMFSAYCH
ncbi:unnamed protein product [Brassica oleracea var. botrytis]|uniref:Uncharacterized protein n=2 Tax=Brassica TaxID=3705 RepID=A0A3P6D6P6_BRAOL|nr:unnamed protein product [Brassica napus]VDD21748.1 unnamed protein product [Brassica oleracea]